MGTFVQNCVCRGTKPRQLAGTHLFSRNHLLSRMIHDRGHVRFLVAPWGFGKSLLACSYAQLVNGYGQTVWVPADNPCFLRDLDDGSLAPGLMEVTGESWLVVFDDVPALGRKRACALWQACRHLCEAGREVVMCLCPAAASPITEHEDCLVLGAADLLMTDEDLAALRDSDVTAWHLSPARCQADRVACLAQRQPGSYERFLAHHIAQTPGVHDRALSLAALVLERGSSDDLSEAMGCSTSLAHLDADVTRAFLSTAVQADAFDASGFPLDEVMRAFEHAAGSVARHLGEADTSHLALRFARLLVGKGSEARAAGLMQGMAKPAVRASWLRANQDLLFARTQLLATEEACQSLPKARYHGKAAFVCGSLARTSLLAASGPPAPDARALAALASPDAPGSTRLLAASMALLAMPASAPAQAVLQLAHSLSSCRPPARLPLAGDADAEALLARFWASADDLPEQADGLLDDARRQLEGLAQEDASQPAEWLPSAEQPLCAANLACLLAACLAKACEMGLLPRSHAAHVRDLAVCSLELAVARRCEGPCELALRRLIDESPALRPPARLRVSLRRLDALAASLEVQQTAFRRTHAVSHAGYSQGALGVQRGSAAEAYDDVDVLHIAIFGRFAVQRGERALNPDGFRRSKVRTLLAMLALEDGRDLSCERLAARMWPDSDSECARRNLYSTISRLKTGLALPGGRCPYLHREPGVVGLNPDVVRSDVSDLELLCRKLRFDEVDPEIFLRTLEQVRAVYKGELLPGENDEPMVVAARSAWREKLVASLMVGAQRVSALSDRQVALQIAQFALEVDPRREDCYEQVMALQADCGQRNAAIDTWFSYCRFTGSELGLDPAPRVKELYHRIISD